MGDPAGGADEEEGVGGQRGGWQKIPAGGGGGEGAGVHDAVGLVVGRLRFVQQAVLRSKVQSARAHQRRWNEVV